MCREQGYHLHSPERRKCFPHRSSRYAHFVPCYQWLYNMAPRYSRAVSSRVPFSLSTCPGRTRAPRCSSHPAHSPCTRNVHRGLELDTKGYPPRPYSMNHFSPYRYRTDKDTRPYFLHWKCRYPPTRAYLHWKLAITAYLLLPRHLSAPL